MPYWPHGNQAPPRPRDPILPGLQRVGILSRQIKDEVEDGLDKRAVKRG
jgi:hypothetical protein